MLNSYNFEAAMNPNLESIFNEINLAHFNNIIKKIPCVWNSRLKTTAGRCHFKRSRAAIYGSSIVINPTKIDINLSLFKKYDFDKSLVFETMAHEMTHAWLIQEYNDKAHSRLFQAKMRTITGENKNHRCHTLNVNGLARNRGVKAHCHNCGIVGSKTRMPRQINGWKCSSCKSSVIWVDERMKGTKVSLKINKR